MLSYLSSWLSGAPASEAAPPTSDGVQSSARVDDIISLASDEDLSQAASSDEEMEADVTSPADDSCVRTWDDEPVTPQDEPVEHPFLKPITFEPITVDELLSERLEEPFEEQESLSDRLESRSLVFEESSEESCEERSLKSPGYFRFKFLEELGGISELDTDFSRLRTDNLWDFLHRAEKAEKKPRRTLQEYRKEKEAEEPCSEVDLEQKLRRQEELAQLRRELAPAQEASKRQERALRSAKHLRKAGRAQQTLGHHVLRRSDRQAPRVVSRQSNDRKVNRNF